MNRRQFISLLSGAAAASPIAARAQQAGKIPTIGFLGGQTPSTAGSWVVAFEQRLHELGWTKGRTVRIEYRWAEGRSERAAEIAADCSPGSTWMSLSHRDLRSSPRRQATSVDPNCLRSSGRSGQQLASSPA